MVILSEKEEKTRVPVLPAACFYHDEEKYTVEIELPGTDKTNIELEVSDVDYVLTRQETMWSILDAGFSLML
jgi:HSP20 family molecular chaperone IbpA